MNNKYDLDFGVHSGETQELDKAYESLENLYQADNASLGLTNDIGKLWDDSMTHWESNDVEGSGDSRPFFDSFKSIRQIPASSFIIAFLAYKNSYPADSTDRYRLSAFVEDFASKYTSATEGERRNEFERIMHTPASKETEGLESEETLLREFAIRVRDVMRLFPELREKTNDDNWVEYFRGMLFNFNFSYLRDIAFAFNMDIEQFDIFLKKALRRSWTNYFNREEILTHIVVQYSETAQSPDDRFQLYNDLCEKYEVRKTKVGHPKAFKGIKSVDAESKMVQEKVESMLLKRDWIGKDIFEYSSELHEILDWVYDRSEKNVLKRSAKRVFDEELDKLLEALANEIIENSTDEAEDASDDGSIGQKCGVLTIEYVANSDCVLKKGLLLSGNSNIKENKRAVAAFYETAEEVQLTAERQRKLSVKVDPITRALPDEAIPAKFVKAEHVQGLFRVDSTPASSPRYEITAEYHDTEPLKLEVHPGNAMHFTANEKAKKGTLDIICAPGTVIYEGTIFSFVYKGRTHQYRVKETETAKWASTVEVPVILMNAADLWIKKSNKKEKYNEKIYVVDTGSSIRFVEGPNIDGLRVFSITNRKPVSATDPTSIDKSKKKKGKANYHSLFCYLYGTDDYRGVTSYGPLYFLNTAEFKAAAPSYNSVSTFPKSEVKARNMLLTLCFLNFVAGDLDSYTYPPGVPRLQGLIDDFTTRCNIVMDKCGFMSLYSGNPYDEFLRRMLTSQNPLDLYMSIFSDQHLMTQYINVNIDDTCGEWHWKVVCMRSDGTMEIWGEGQVKKGPSLITMPRLVAKNGSKYKIIISYKERIAERDIILNASQKCEISI